MLRMLFLLLGYLFYDINTMMIKRRKDFRASSVVRFT
jgi:hypothetical protein